MTHHMIAMIPVKADRTENYGITHASVYIYGRAQRIEAWDNRPDKRPGRTFGQLVDPYGRPTTDAQTVLISPEAVCLSAHGDSTGTVASGQVWAPGGEVLREGDTVRLLWIDAEVGSAPRVGELYRVTYKRHGNYHGQLDPVHDQLTPAETRERALDVDADALAVLRAANV